MGAGQLPRLPHDFRFVCVCVCVCVYVCMCVCLFVLGVCFCFLLVSSELSHVDDDNTHTPL